MSVSFSSPYGYTLNSSYNIRYYSGGEGVSPYFYAYPNPVNEVLIVQTSSVNTHE